MPLLAQYSFRFQIYFLVLWGKCQALNEFIPKNHIFVCFYSSVSSENINRFQTPLIPRKIAQGKAITKALKEAKLTSSAPKPSSMFILEQQLSQQAQEGSSNRSPNIPKLPLGDSQPPLDMAAYTDFSKMQLRSDAIEYLNFYVSNSSLQRWFRCPCYIGLGVLSWENWKNKQAQVTGE